jgi:hypothetical protein
MQCLIDVDRNGRSRSKRLGLKANVKEGAEVGPRAERGLCAVATDVQRPKGATSRQTRLGGFGPSFGVRDISVLNSKT